MPIPISKTVLKSYFETGKVPTQAQFHEKIDTLFYHIQDVYNRSQQTAGLILTALPGIFYVGRVAASGVASPAIEFRNFGVSAADRVDTAATFNSVKLTFATPLTNALYYVELVNCTEGVKHQDYYQINLTNANAWSVAIFPSP